MKKILFVLALIALPVAVFGATLFGLFYLSDPTTETPSSAPEVTAPSSNDPIIYVNIVSHNEDTLSPQYPDYQLDEASLQEERTNVAAFAEMLAKHGATYDFQSDWNFLLGLQAHETPDESTDNKNLLTYLVDLGMSVDPHSHEHLGYNYADVAYLMSTFGITPSGVVGGFIAGPAESSKLENYWNGAIQGSKYPSYSWTPTVLWGGGTGLHINESDLWISGVWRPQDAEHFDVHDANAPIAVVGHYNSDWTGLDDLLEKQANGELEDGKMYTITLMTNQRNLTEDFISAFEEKLKGYADETAEGKIIWATVPETYEAWQTVYDESPSIVHWTGGEEKSELAPSSLNESTSSGTPSKKKGTCGDNICAAMERQMNVCPADCN